MIKLERLDWKVEEEWAEEEWTLRIFSVNSLVEVVDSSAVEVVVSRLNRLWDLQAHI